MPNAKVLSEKQAIVAALTERIKNASSGVFVDYKGINVAQDTELRTELRKNDVEYSVIKNTLTRFALDDCGLKEIDPILNGTTSLATSTGDPIAPARIVSQFSKRSFTIENIQFCVDCLRDVVVTANTCKSRTHRVDDIIYRIIKSLTSMLSLEYLIIDDVMHFF